MRKWILALAAMSMLATACEPQEYQPQTPAVYRTAADCLQVNQDNLYTTGQHAVRYLTIAAADSAFPPWWEGGTTREHSEWKLNDPYLGKGFEGALAFGVSERLGFSRDHVRFVPIGSDDAVAPGPKDFDFALEQISYLPERAHAVDLSDGYYDVSLALVSSRGSPIGDATTLEALKHATLGAPTATNSLRYIEDTIQPSAQPVAFDDLRDAVRSLKLGRVDGIVLDLPSALVITRSQIPEGVIVGKFRTSREHFVIALEKGSPLVRCVDLALREMKDDGTLDEIRRKWLPGTTDVPVIDG